MAQNRMPHPGSKKGPGIMIAVGVGPKKPGEDDMPPKPPEANALKDPDEDDDNDDGGKMDPSKALVSHADENCANCQNYDPSSGDCSKVSGTFSPDDRCYAGYEPLSTGGGDQMAEAPPSMSDAMAAPGGPAGQ